MEFETGDGKCMFDLQGHGCGFDFESKFIKIHFD